MPNTSDQGCICNDDGKSAVDWSDKLVNHSALLTRALDKGILVRTRRNHMAGTRAIILGTDI